MKDSGIEWVGQIPADWNVGRIKYNYYLKGRIGWQGLKANEFIDDGPFLVTGTDFWGGRVDWSSCYHISEERYDEAPEIHVCKGDLLITKDGTVGKVAYIDDKPEKVSLNSHLLIMRPVNMNYENRFLFWVIQSPVFDKYCLYSQNGTIMASLSQEKINDFSYAIPAKAQQIRIADYLDAKCSLIDSIISKQEQIIEKLKEYKFSVITEAVTKGLDPNVEMKDSGVEWIGKIPSSWELSKAKRYVTITNGSDPISEGDIPVYGSGERSFKTCGEYKEGPCVLLGRKGATLHIPHYIEGKYWNVDTAFDVKTKTGLSLRYYYYMAICFDYKQYISQTTLPGMTQTHYGNMLIPIPTLLEQNEIVSYLDNKEKSISLLLSKYSKVLDRLVQYKKSLIYEVVTGKKEV